MKTRKFKCIGKKEEVQPEWAHEFTINDVYEEVDVSLAGKDTQEKYCKQSLYLQGNDDKLGELIPGYPGWLVDKSQFDEIL